MWCWNIRFKCDTEDQVFNIVLIIYKFIDFSFSNWEDCDDCGRESFWLSFQFILLLWENSFRYSMMTSNLFTFFSLLFQSPQLSVIAKKVKRKRDIFHSHHRVYPTWHFLNLSWQKACMFYTHVDKIIHCDGWGNGRKKGIKMIFFLPFIYPQELFEIKISLIRRGDEKGNFNFFGEKSNEKH